MAVVFCRFESHSLAETEEIVETVTELIASRAEFVRQFSVEFRNGGDASALSLLELTRFVEHMESTMLDAFHGQLAFTSP